MSDIDSLLDKVKTYNPTADLDYIRKAYDFAREAHADQVRDGGDPYITHPLTAAEILADLEMDTPSIVAGLLHDVVEDNKDLTLDDVKREFGEEVASLVDGVTKLAMEGLEIRQKTDGKESHKTEGPKRKRTEADRRKLTAENMRKIFLAMSKDLRVMVIKLADRLHNMMTLDAKEDEESRTRIALETMQIYAPLAHRLGIWQIKWQLEDLAFKYLEPEAFAELTERMKKTRKEREEDIAEAVDMLQKHLQNNGIDAYIMARPKHLWSIHTKMKRENLSFDEIMDLSAIRVVVNRVADCYSALGLVHDLWMPIRELFFDYIAKPKPNMYMSLHTKVIGPRGEPLEVQIRTWDMHRLAEYGVAAHWQYKEQMRSGDEFERKLSFLRQQLWDWQQDSKNASDFLRSVTTTLFADQVLVFTPRGDVIDLAAGSTPVDFAYRIHSDVGNRCVGAKVNGRIVPLSYKFQNGDIIEIITRSNHQPSLDWLTFVKTANARNKIKAYFRRLQYDDSVTKGREQLERELARMGHDAQALLKGDEVGKVWRDLNLHSEDDLYAAIGFGHVQVGNVITRMHTPEPAKPEPTLIEGPKQTGKTRLAVTLDGVKNLMITRAKCCAPLPGEQVIGYVTRGKGVVLHRLECPNAAAFAENEPERIVEINWNAAAGEKYPVELKLKTLDKVGSLHEITSLLSESRTNIVRASVRPAQDKTADLDITIDVDSAGTLSTIIDKLTGLPNVVGAVRTSAKIRPKARKR